MRKNYLLPNCFKKIGMAMFLPFLAACTWLLLGPCEGEWMKLSVPALLTFDGHGKWFTVTETDPVNEVCMLGLLVSLTFMALSREKDEDEMTAAVRTQSFVWSFWSVAAIELVAILFTYDFAFLYFAFASVFACFFLYVCKFNYEMTRIRKAVKEDEA